MTIPAVKSARTRLAAWCMTFLRGSGVTLSSIRRQLGRFGRADCLHRGSVLPALHIRTLRRIFLDLRDQLLRHLRAARAPAMRRHRLEENLARPFRVVGLADELV